MKQNYKINEVKKTITATIANLDAVEKEIVQMYINAGYKLVKGKSSPWNKKSISAWLKANVGEAEAEKFEKAVEKNWINARTEFFNTYGEKIEAVKAEQKAKAEAKKAKNKKIAKSEDK